MGEEAKPQSTKSNMHAIVLGILGLVLLFVGIYVITVHGAPLRGSGFGTVATLLGLVLLIIGGLRFFYKKH